MCGQRRSETAHFVQPDLDLPCPQKFLVLSSVRKELTHSHTMTPFDTSGKQAF